LCGVQTLPSRGTGRPSQPSQRVAWDSTTATASGTSSVTGPATGGDMRRPYGADGSVPTEASGRAWQTGTMVEAVRRVSVEERRPRLGRRHLLAGAGADDDAVDVARGVVALHATDPATVHLAAAARMRAPTVQAIEDAMYERRALVRMLGMRRTMFV